MTKRRITVTVDEEVYLSALRAVEDGRADSVSGWVNTALVRQWDDEDRLRALAVLVAEYEAEHGRITEEQMAETERRDREAAAAVRARRATRRRAG